MAVDETKPRTAGGKPYQRKSDGMWCASIELPSPDPTKRRRKVIVRAKKGDLITARREALRELDRAGDLPTASPTVAQWCDLWWKRYGMKRLKVSTREAYRSKIDQYIKPAIGRVRLDRLSVEHIYRLHDFIIVTKGLDPNTALGAHRVLSTIVSDAEKEGRAGRNVVKLADKPRVAKKKTTYLDNAQSRALLVAAAADLEHQDELARWATALMTGARPGERLGLTTDALDFSRRVLTISWELQRLVFEHGCGQRAADGAWPCRRKRGGNCPQRQLDIPPDQEVRHIEGGLYLTRPKSRAGWREIPMIGLLHATLERHLEHYPPGKEGLIFTRDGGRPIDPSDDSAAWDAALRRAGLPDVNRRSARHSCNTILTELKVPVDVRRQILGHASNAINEAVYTHTSDVRVADAMKQIDGALDWREAQVSSSTG